MIKNKKGVTLIALIVTIIILLIIAAVSIAFLSGENGILNKAQSAKEEQARAEAEEQLKLKLSDYLVNNLGGSDLTTIDGISIDGYQVGLTGIGRIVAMTKDGQTYNFLVDDKFNVTGINSGSNAFVGNSSNLIGDFTPVIIENSDGTLTVSVPTDIANNLNVAGYAYRIAGKIAKYSASSTEIINTQDTPVAESYNVDILAMDITGNIRISSPVSKITDNIKFGYTGKYQILNISKDGKYKIECWGASGGDGRLTTGGNGAYTSGEISLSKGTKLYIYIGQQGKAGANVGFPESWNGGAKAIHKTTTPHDYLTTGGGATDVRILSTSSDSFWNEIESLSSRIMVAAGGGRRRFLERLKYVFKFSNRRSWRRFNWWNCFI